MPTLGFAHTRSVIDVRPMRVTFLGHSTLLIELDGIRILTDPILRPRVGPLVRVQDAIDAEQWSAVDAVLISHSHWDHLDYGSLRLVGSATPIVAPKGMAGALRRRGFGRVSELLPGNDFEVGATRVEAVHAEHRGFGPPVSATELAIGFVIHGSQRAYFAGDTAYFEAMAGLDIGLDVAFVPVWGWGPTVRPSEHLDPMGAARAISVIKPRYAVPIHWGTLHPLGLRWVRPATRIDPPHQFERLAHRLAPRTIVRVLPVGSSFDVPRISGSALRPPASAAQIHDEG